MNTRARILLCICLLVVLAVLAGVMQAQFPKRIDLPFDTPSTILAAEFIESPEELNAVLGSDRRWAEPLKTQQYVDYPFIACYVALFVLLGLTLTTYDVPAARWLGWLAIAAAVVAGVCDVMENLTILKAMSSTYAPVQVRQYSLPKWGLVFFAMFIESGVFFFWPKLGLWWRAAAIVTGCLWLVAGSSGTLFASLSAASDIPWSVSWMQWAIAATLAFLIAIAVRDFRRAA
jgi:hypothetical protein